MQAFNRRMACVFLLNDLQPDIGETDIVAAASCYTSHPQLCLVAWLASCADREYVLPVSGMHIVATTRFVSLT